MTVGYLASCFDLLNVTDLDLIAQARQQCSVLIVGVFSDDFAVVLHGRRPVVPLNERMTLVSHVRGVHEVRVHDDSWQAFEVDVTFSVAGEPELPGTGTRWSLTPRRQTASSVLREALRRVPGRDVA